MRLTFFVLFSMWCAYSVHAQNATSSSRIGFSVQTFSASGTTSIQNPRAGKVFAEATYVRGSFSAGLHVDEALEKSLSGQPLSTRSAWMRYAWAEVRVGDYAPTLTRLTLESQNIRGAEVRFTPGPLDVQFLGGRLQQAVGYDAAQPFRPVTYAREVYGVRLGVGEMTKSHFHLIGMVLRDDTTSIAARDVPATAFAPLPAENVSITPSVGLSLFQSRWTTRFSGTVSVISRDTRAEALDLEEAGLPSWITNIFTPRLSSRADFALEGETAFTQGPVELRAEYLRVQPGFETLGAPFLRTDLQEFSFFPRLSLMRGALRVDGRFQSSTDNLLDLRDVTQSRWMTGLNTTYRFSQRFTLSGGYLYALNEGTPRADADPRFARRFALHTLMLAPALTWRSGTTQHTLTLNGRFVNQVDEAPAGGTATPGLTTLVGTGAYTLRRRNTAMYSTTANAIHTDSPFATTRVLSLALGTTQPLLNRTLRVQVNSTLTQTRVTTAAMGNRPATERDILRLGGDARVRYRLPFGGELDLGLRAFQAVSGTNTPVRELRTFLQFERRF